MTSALPPALYCNDHVAPMVPTLAAVNGPELTLFHEQGFLAIREAFSSDAIGAALAAIYFCDGDAEEALVCHEFGYLHGIGGIMRPLECLISQVTLGEFPDCVLESSLFLGQMKVHFSSPVGSPALRCLNCLECTPHGELAH